MSFGISKSIQNNFNNCVISGHPTFQNEAHTQRQDVQEALTDRTYYPRGMMVSILYVVIGTILIMCVYNCCVLVFMCLSEANIESVTP
jgi:phage gp36-like protein